MAKKVIVGLSGGVDSSVAAYLLKEQGYEVTGVTMSIWNGNPELKNSTSPSLSFKERGSGGEFITPRGSGGEFIKGAGGMGKHSCYGPDENEEIAEARELARILDIPYQVFDCSQRYKTLVLDYFKSEYLSGRTPNPCVKCNSLIKFGMLPDAAKREGLEFDYFATGHYALVEWDEERKRYLLKRGSDSKKDQTYFIYRLTQEQLSKVLFPIGKMTKQEVREIAAKINIPLSEKEESQDFYSGDYKDLLDMKDQPGEILNSKGKVLGSHNGFWNYTIGQRKGLGVAFSEPLYVLSLDKDQNAVIVGTREEVMSSEFIVNDLNWIAFESLKGEMEVTVKIRSTQNGTPATIEPIGEDAVKVTFHSPNDGITPGQSAVFYQDDLVLGGGIINV